MSNTNSNFEKIVKSRKSNPELSAKRFKHTQKRGYGSKRYAGLEG